MLRLKQCERCSAMIRLNGLRCGPCQDDVRREKKKLNARKRAYEETMATK